MPALSFSGVASSRLLRPGTLHLTRKLPVFLKCDMLTVLCSMAGARIEIHTDHKNLTLNNFQSMRLLKWRVTLAELCPKLVYKPGEQNIVADGL